MTPTTITALAAVAASYHPLHASAQPYSDCDIGTYYSSLPSAPLDAARDDMHALIKGTHRDQLPYSSSSYGDVWDALMAVDSDASGENVKLVYRDAWVPAMPYDRGTCEYWNREHVWSRSHGIGSSGKDYTDLHHLRPADCNVNSARNNLYFGACGTVVPSSECTSPAHPEAAIDTEKDSATFLPPARNRGDVARAILYMDLRYDGDEGSTTSDLVVSDCPESVPDDAGMGYLSQLLQWHMEDPPDEEEKQRNEKVCADWQGNRNPFVDYPELASMYHGTSRPILGDGLGYDCEVPPPPAGTCSDALRRKLETTNLVITGVLDGPLPGGLPKMVELYALNDILDLSVYGIGSANNGGGTDGQEFTLSGSASANTFITISYEETEFVKYFGELPTFTSGKLNINGDDAIELFFNGDVVDTFGDSGVDGTHQDWEYKDGWAYRQEVGSLPGSSFVISEWTLSGADAVDGCTSNESCGISLPFKSFGAGACECVV